MDPQRAGNPLLDMRSFIPLSLCLGLALTLGCNANLGSDGSGEDAETSGDGDSGDGDSGDGDGFAPCTSNNPCPDGQFCFNGLCAPGCLSDEDCADNQYCGTDTDLLCHNNEVPTCSSDDQCASSQLCINGYCAAIPEQNTGCNLEDYLNDGCPSNAVCLEDLDNEGVGICYQMPACGADGSCPIGLEGAVCNQDYLPSKDEICLVGICDTVANCPSDWSCVRFNQSVVGVCSSGTFGSPCETAADCLSGMCTTIPGFGGGFCG